MAYSIQQTLITQTVRAVKDLYGADLPASQVTLQETRKEFEGHITIVVFPVTRFSKKSPEQTGADIGNWLQTNLQEIAGYNVIKGFLNISLSDAYWISLVNDSLIKPEFGVFAANGKKLMVEYSSPNTNKPLHLGHIRNNLLGFSVAEILKAYGYDVVKANLVNDRGIHICKSMLAWQLFGNGETPTSTGLKGDHLVGKYYVAFESELRKQAGVIFESYITNSFNEYPTEKEAEIRLANESIENLTAKRTAEIEKLDFASIDELGDLFSIKVETAIDNDIKFSKLSKAIVADTEDDLKEHVEDKLKQFDKLIKDVVLVEAKIEDQIAKIMEIARSRTAVMLQAQLMLQQWEAGDEKVINLWKTMNGWVYEGFEKTYNQLGVDFDKYYYESNTYLLGKDIIQEGLASGVFFQKEDNSVWIDLTDEGLDQKLVLRGDGTSVYITQDLGTAQLKYDEFQMDESIYVVGNEQDYHFKVLFLILKKLGKTWADGLFHLSYGMVDLPSGKMKSREGTVVDADDLMAEMVETAKTRTEELGKTEGLSEEEKASLYYTIGMGALKYFLLKVDPKKRLLFDPNESVDFQGHTGPFIQYTHARIKSVLRKAEFASTTTPTVPTKLSTYEQDLIQVLSSYPQIIEASAKEFSPAQMANYAYEVAKTYNKFYHEETILKAEDQDVKTFRLHLSAVAARIIAESMGLLGIQVPERM